MDAIILGFQEVAHWQVILALFMGAIAGILVGAIPGMEPAGAMAIALRFSLTMEPLPGIILLLGCYGEACYGGAIPAILIRVPGTPVHVLTTYDGYPLGQKGQPMRALSLLSPGIPADPLMAMLLAVFMIHNIIPGPQLFVEQADFVAGLYLSQFLLNIFVLALLLIFTRHIVKLSSITPRAIGAAIMVLGFIGTYTQNFRLTDAFFTLFFAVVGRFMLKNGVPAFPMVVGLVLGPMMEGRVKQALSISQGDPTILVTRPIAAVFLALAVLAVAVFGWNHIKHKAAT